MRFMTYDNTLLRALTWTCYVSGLVSFAPALFSGAARADVVWSSYAGDPRHTALSGVASQPLNTIRWQMPVDLAPQFSGNDLLIHYGSPVITADNTVIVPVKTGANDGFEVRAVNALNGGVKWTQTSDYTLPPHSWTPSYSPALTSSGRLYMPGAGGTVLYRDNPDTPSGASGRVAFFGGANYSANASELNGKVYINTPITSDKAGNIYFGFQVTAGNTLNLSSGIARIAPDGSGAWVPASAAASDSGIARVAMNSAPALSPDGKTVYVAVNDGASGRGALLALNSTTLATTAVRPLKDPANGFDAMVNDNGTASPTVGPDGRVYFGVLDNPLRTAKGWLLSFDANLNPISGAAPGAFGWDDTASIVPAGMVPSYTGTAPYLLMTKYNDYAGFGGTGDNRIAILDPSSTMIDLRTGVTVMRVVMSIAGPTPDPDFFPSLPDAVREWCINTAVVDPFTHSILANSEDGKLYRWDLDTNTFTQSLVLTPGIGEAYTPTLIGPDGTTYAINNATLFAVGAIPEPAPLAVLGMGVLGLSGWRHARRGHPARP